MSTTTLMTVAQFDALPDEEIRQYELSQGELIEVAGANPSHSLVRENLSYWFVSHRRQHASGLSLCESDFALTPDTVRRPDLAFIAAGRRSQFPMEKRLRGAPDLAVEIISPSELYDGVLRKVADYLGAGVQSVWVISLEHRSAFIWTKENPPQYVPPTGTLTCAELLPGFSVRLEELFNGL